MPDLEAGQAAEWYGRKGYPVFPVHSVTPDGCTCGCSVCGSPGKHPMIIRWPEKASADEGVIRFWWKRWPEANVGLVTGAVSGLVVLDVDVRHDGHFSLAELEDQHGALPVTVEAETGSGGRHLFFRHPGRRIPNSAGLLGKGLDIRGDGGYIVAPPSLHASGRRYTWDPSLHPANVEPAKLPQWMLKLLASPGKAPAPQGSNGPLSDLAFGEAQKGQRNTNLARLAGHLLRCHVDPFVAVGLLKAWNLQQCHPPLEEEELMRTIDSIAGAELRRRRWM